MIATRFSPILYELRPGSSPPTPAPPTALTTAADAVTLAEAERVEGAHGGNASLSESMAGAAHPGGAADGWMSSLPYRVLWAVATLESIVVYDSSLPQPLLVASNVHYAALTDLAWLPDGSGLIASSMDGYCTLIRFKPGALGSRLPAEHLPAAPPLASEH